MGRLIETKTDLAVEYDCHAGQVPVTVDFENKTYDIRYDEIYNPDWIPHKDLTEKMGFPYTEEPQRIFGVSTSFGINESYQDSICVPIEDTVIVRIEGTLWLTGLST